MTLIRRINANGTTEVDDTLAVEEPLEIRVNDKAVSVTLRTPGDDFDLAAGFLFTESIVRGASDVESFRHWGSPNVVRIGLREGVRVDLQRLQRNFYSASSCGVCGKASIDAVRVHTTPLESKLAVAPAGVTAL
ncbi:MAG TPA: formate dehydrogenase accessory sulfurtransferase FdhD, partial [Thermoanaerobaculia bacterium]|nr:formate dehydrogenase accessory sulfurtransferase FdhD [Thermoanaerobaculia bacterium]